MKPPLEVSLKVKSPLKVSLKESLAWDTIQICRQWKAVFESDVETCIDWMSFNFLFESAESAAQNNHPLCYWPTIHNLILKTCHKFQDLNSQISAVDGLLNEHGA